MDNGQGIPKIAHFVWIGSNPIPVSGVEIMDRFFELHPGWKIEIWDNDRVAKLLEKYPEIREAWQFNLDNFAIRALLARLGAVYDMGGVAVDFDMFMVRSMNKLLEVQRDNFFAVEHFTKVSSCLFAATRGHRLMKIGFKVAAEKKVSNANRLLYEIRDVWPRPRFNVLPEHYFCPIRTKSEARDFLRKWPQDQVIDLEKRKGRYKDTEMPFGVHLWGSGYVTPPMFTMRYPTEPTAYPKEEYEIKDLTPEEEIVVKEQGIDAIQDDGKRAGFFRKLVNVAGAAGRVVKAVVKKEKLAADPELVKQRFQICKTSGDNGGPCHYLNGLTCSKCGCVLAFKQRLATESCPIGRW